MKPIKCYQGIPQFYPQPTPASSVRGLQEIPIKIPPVFLPALQVDPKIQYVCLTYQNTNCYVETPWGGSSESFWVYSAFVGHFVVAIHLLEYELGSDDFFPAHGLLIDQYAQKLWVASYREIKQFLGLWKAYSCPDPLLTPSQIEELYQAMQQEISQSSQVIVTTEIDELVYDLMRQERQAIIKIQLSLDQQLLSAVNLALTKHAELQRIGNMQALIELELLMNQLRQELGNSSS